MNKIKTFDLAIIGAGPVGLMCAYLAELSGLSVLIIDKSSGPLEVGRADALNARTLQLLETVDLFEEVYPLGKQCSTSSIWAGGEFISRESAWWDELEGCMHKHFLMLGQSHIERILDHKLKESSVDLRRETSIKSIDIADDGCFAELSSGEKVRSKYIIGADGSRSFVRNLFEIPFEIERPQIIWAVIDGIIESSFPKVPEIIVFQAETSDVAWIPREGDIDRFYIRMDKKEFTQEEVLAKINRAMSPHTLSFKEIEWFSQFSVKESVAENFFVKDRVFLAGDSCHIHSVNGGQGLNTGLADAFNLIWKLNMKLRFNSKDELLVSYENERKPIARSVIETSGELVRATKYSESGSHAKDYLEIVKKRAGNITGMGISYGEEKGRGSRIFDLKLHQGSRELRLYSLLDYTKFTLLIFGDNDLKLDVPEFINIISISNNESRRELWTKAKDYKEQAILVRPDSYIVFSCTQDDVQSSLNEYLLALF